MPKKTRKGNKNNLKIGIIFSLLIFFLIGLSLVFKLIFLLGQGKYDDNYPFSLRVDNGRFIQYISVFPKQHKINILNFNVSTVSGSLIQVPQDAEVSGGPARVSASNISSYFSSLIGEKNFKTNMTDIDLGRLYIFSKTISLDDVTSQDISGIDEKTDKIISSLFSDPTIISEGLRVEVVNATGVYGVGNKVAQLLSYVGVNVVFVSTADSIEKQSVIYYSGSKSYTVQRIGRLMKLDAIANKQKTISDIIVRIGQDSKALISK